MGGNTATYRAGRWGPLYAHHNVEAVWGWLWATVTFKGLCVTHQLAHTLAGGDVCCD